MILSLTYLFLSVISYIAIVFMTGSPFDSTVFQVPMMSDVTWTFTLADMLITGTLFLLFIEILKATRTSGKSLIDHALSTIVFIICIIEFLVVPEAATSLFFVITLITLIDVIAGFSVTIRAARRDFAVGSNSF